MRRDPSDGLTARCRRGVQLLQLLLLLKSTCYRAGSHNKQHYFALLAVCSIHLSYVYIHLIYTSMCVNLYIYSVYISYIYLMNVINIRWENIRIYFLHHHFNRSSSYKWQIRPLSPPISFAGFRLAGASSTFFRQV